MKNIIRVIFTLLISFNFIWASCSTYKGSDTSSGDLMINEAMGSPTDGWWVEVKALNTALLGERWSVEICKSEVVCQTLTYPDDIGQYVIPYQNWIVFNFGVEAFSFADAQGHYPNQLFNIDGFSVILRDENSNIIDYFGFKNKDYKWISSGASACFTKNDFRFPSISSGKFSIGREPDGTGGWDAPSGNKKDTSGCSNDCSDGCTDCSYNPTPNTQPTILKNSMQVSENSTTTITTSDLNTIDNEQSAIDITYTLQSIPSEGNLFFVNSGTPLGIGNTFTQKNIDDGKVIYKHNGGSATSDSFNFKVSDGVFAIYGVMNISISHSPTNPDNVVLTPIEEDNVTSSGDTIASIVTKSNSTDADGDTLGIAIINIDITNGRWEYYNGGWNNIPDNLSIYSALLLPATSKVRFVPNANFYGNATFNFKVWDGNEGVSFTRFNIDNSTSTSQNSTIANIEVTPVNDPPVISGTPTTETTINVEYRFTPSASDIENDNLTFSISCQSGNSDCIPSWANFNTSTGELVGTPDSSELNKKYEGIIISVSDGVDTASLAPFDIEIKDLTNLNFTCANPKLFAEVFNENMYGNMQIIGNTILCKDSNGANSGGNCANPGNDRNNNIYMMYIPSSDSGVLYGASLAKLTLPPNSEIVFAKLYWQGYLYNKSDSEKQKMRIVKFKAPNSSEYSNLLADDVNWVYYDSTRMYYQSMKDVTNIVKNAGEGWYKVADIITSEGKPAGGSYGGWSLAVAYKDPTQNKMKNIVAFDGYISVAGDTDVNNAISYANSKGCDNSQDKTGVRKIWNDIPMQNFITPLSGDVNSTLFIFAGEGDKTATGDYLRMKNKSGSYVAISDSHNPANDIFNASITYLGDYVTDLDPSYPSNSLAIDIDSFDVGVNGKDSEIIGNEQYNTALQIQTSGDGYNPGLVALSTELYAPNICYHEIIYRNGMPLTDQDFVAIGDNLEINVTIKNDGNDPALGLMIDKSFYLPFKYLNNTTYVEEQIKTDGYDSDVVDYNEIASVLRLRLGDGANGNVGGTLAYSEETNLSYQATILAYPISGVIDNIYKVYYQGSSINIDYHDSVPKCEGDVTIYPKIYVSNLFVDLNVSPKDLYGDVTVNFQDTIYYDINITNFANADETNLQLIIDLENGFQYDNNLQSGTNDNWSCQLLANKLNCDLTGSIKADGNYSNLNFSLTAPNSEVDFNTIAYIQSSIDNISSQSQPQRIIVKEGKIDFDISLNLKDENNNVIADGGVLYENDNFSYSININKQSTTIATDVNVTLDFDSSKILIDTNELDILKNNNTIINYLLVGNKLTIILGNLSNNVSFDIKAKAINSGMDIDSTITLITPNEPNIGTQSDTKRLNIESGVAAYYSFDVCSLSDGDTVEDVNGSDYNGTAKNSLSTVSSSEAGGGLCRVGKFNRSSKDYVEIPNMRQLSSGVTITAWIKPSADFFNQGQADGRIFIRDEANTQGGYALSLGDGGAKRLRFFIRNSAGNQILDSDPVIEPDNWYFVAATATLNPKKLIIYVYDKDKNLIHSKSIDYSGNWLDNTGKAAIGGEVEGDPEYTTRWAFDGYIDEVGIFYRTLTQAKIEEVMNMSRSCISCIMPNPKEFQEVFNQNIQGDMYILTNATDGVSNINLPANANIKYARLYWQGYLTNYNSNSKYSQIGNIVFDGHSLSDSDVGRVIYGSDLSYQASSEVDINWITSGSHAISQLTSDDYSTWQLVVVYENKIDLKKVKNITIQDGFMGIVATANKDETNGLFETNSTLNFLNFTDTNMSIFATAGDIGGNDRIRVNATDELLNKIENASDFTTENVKLEKATFSTGSDEYFVGVVSASVERDLLNFVTTLPSNTEIGEEITVSVTITNIGDKNLNNIYISPITIINSDKFELVNPSFSINFSTLNVGDSETFTYQVKVKNAFSSSDFEVKYIVDMNEVSGNSFEDIEFINTPTLTYTPHEEPIFDMSDYGRSDYNITTKVVNNFFDLVVKTVDSTKLENKNYQVKVKIVDKLNSDADVMSWSNWKLINDSNSPYSNSVTFYFNSGVSGAYRYLKPVIEWRLVSEAEKNSQNASPIKDDNGIDRSGNYEATDPFAVRPNSFNLTFPTPNNARAGENFTMSLTTTPTNNYNEREDSNRSFTLSANLRHNGVFNFTANSFNNNDDFNYFNEGSLAFSSGSTGNFDANISEVGNFDINISDGNGNHQIGVINSCNSCVGGIGSSCITTNGCPFACIDILDSSCNGLDLINTATNTIIITPYAYRIKGNPTFNLTNWLYMGGINENRYIEVNATIEAINLTGNPTTNFTNSIFDGSTAPNININAFFKFNINNPSSEIVDINYSTATFNPLSSIIYTPNSDIDGNNIFETIAILGNSLNNVYSNEMNVSVRFNINKNSNTPINPIEIGLREINTTNSETLPASFGITNGENMGYLGTQANDQNASFYYGRVWASDQYETTENYQNVEIKAEIYCENCIDFNLLSGDENDDNVYWYQNNQDNFTPINNIQSLTTNIVTNSGISTTSGFIGSTGTIGILNSLITKDGSEYGKADFNISTSKYMWFQPYGTPTQPQFSVTFKDGTTNNLEPGVNRNLNPSDITKRRIDW